MPVDSRKLRELVEAIKTGKVGREAVLTALADAADRLDAREAAYTKLKEGATRQAWSLCFAGALAGYLADPTIAVEDDEAKDRMLLNVNEIAEDALVFWKHRWAGGPPPRAKIARDKKARRRAEVAEAQAKAQAEPLATAEETRAHVAEIKSRLAPPAKRGKVDAQKRGTG
jgi:hypothetical protein